MRIMYCVSTLSKMGGITKLTIDKANELTSRGYDVIIATLEPKGKAPITPIDSQVEIHYLDCEYDNVYKYGMLLRVFYLINLKNKYRLKLSELIKNSIPDIIVDTCGTEIDFIEKIKCKAKIVSEVHHHKLDRVISIKSKYNGTYRKYLYLLIEKLIRVVRDRKIKNFDAVVLLNSDELKLYDVNKNIYRVIPNFVSIPEDEVTNRDKVVLAAGRLTKMKSMSQLIEIWAKVYPNHQEWKLMIFGEGDEKLLIKKLIKNSGLEKSVEIHEPSHKYFEALKKASILVSSSQLESFGMTILEAQAHGVPVISYDCPTGPRHIIEHGTTGALVELNNKKEFSHRLNDFISQSVCLEKMAIASKLNSKNYDINTVVDKWELLFEELTYEK